MGILANIYALQNILIPLFICVVLPLGIVITVFISKNHISNNKTKLMTEAIKSGNVDPVSVIKMMQASHKTYRWRMIMNLRSAAILCFLGIAFIISMLITEPGNEENFIPGILLLAIGLGFLVSYFMIRKQLPALNAEQEKENEKDNLIL